MRELHVPLSEAEVRALRAGDMVSLSGTIITARDAAHKYMVEQLIAGRATSADAELHAQLQAALRNGAIFHCGPVMEQVSTQWRVVAAGPTTSSREEDYEDQVIAHFGVRAIIGKGGMGERTRAACQKYGAVYLHAVGGAAAVLARNIPEVTGVWKLDLGVPEAMWQLRVVNMQLMVTIDAHGHSWHEDIAAASADKLQQLLQNG